MPAPPPYAVGQHQQQDQRGGGGAATRPVILERRGAPPGAVAKNGMVPTGLLLRKPATPEASSGSSIVAAPPSLVVPPVTTSAAVSVSPNSALQIVDRHQRFQLSEAAHRFLSDLPGSFVVGVLGGKRVGKSAVLSHLATNTKIFSPGTTTTGVNLHVTPERVILLDSHALHVQQSASFPRTEMIQSIRLAAFMMTVCHTIIVVGMTPECSVDHDILTFLRRIETLRHRIFSLPTKDEGRERVPNIIYVANKCPGSAFTVDAYHTIADEFLTSFKNTRARITGGTVGIELVFPYYKKPPSTEPSQQAGDEDPKASTPNVFLLPRAPALEQPKQQPATTTTTAAATTTTTTTAPVVVSSANDASSGATTTRVQRRRRRPPPPPILSRLIDFGVPARFEIMLKLLRNQIFETPRFATPANAASRRALFGPSEREWLKMAARMWEIVRKADVATEWVRSGK
ncbi:smg-9, nonsense mediated mRNA decay factor [Geranomyces variabilis]|uniref:Smg-9, nonsense mediated mRNA decay factor n=1 Tax=Geranomyces variabilis TaxID=109894 RepID=A0AAD5TE07_9FUNG|nr:smg-9, nonsense mediated mRNA decay factor [Geranomyces variabilis]